MTKIITVTSGKGGVGKTNISLNLSLSLAARGFKVCLFDADLGLANVNILTGLYPKNDLASVIDKKLKLKDIIIKNYQGIDIIPGSTGVEKIANLSETDSRALLKAFLDLEAYDYFIFDTSAGISRQVLSFCIASHEIWLVITHEPTSLTDAYSLLKILSKNKYSKKINVIVNQVKTGKSAHNAYSQLKKAVDKFLTIKINPLGIVALDDNVRSSIISQIPFYLLYPDCAASKCINVIANKLVHRKNSPDGLPIELFWEKWFSLLSKKKKAHAPLKAVSRLTKPDHPQSKNDIQTIFLSIETKVTQLLEEIKNAKRMINGAQRRERLLSSAGAALPVNNKKALPLDFEQFFGMESGQTNSP